MPPSKSSPDGGCPGRSPFPPTRWSVVVAAGRDSSPDARRSLGDLYETYRPALLAFLVRSGPSEQEAEEILHGFFERLLEGNRLGQVRKEGKFRSWLLKSLKNYRNDLFDKSTAQKRGSGHAPIPLDLPDESPVPIAHPGRAPDQEYERLFALQLIKQVFTRLEEDYSARGKSELFRLLRPFLLDKKGETPQSELARQLGVKENQMNLVVSRFRKRFRELFDQELMDLVEDESEIEEEKQFLFRSVAG